MARLKWSGSLKAQRSYEEYIRQHPPKPKKKSKAKRKAERKRLAAMKAKEAKKVARREAQERNGRVYFPNYQDYLNGPWWQSKRRDKLKSVGFRCQRCRSEKELQVHHKHYRTLGREKNRDLEVLCRTCHETTHECLVQCDSHLRSINNT